MSYAYLAVVITVLLLLAYVSERRVADTRPVDFVDLPPTVPDVLQCSQSDYPAEMTGCSADGFLSQERYKCDTATGRWVFEKWATTLVRCPVELTGWDYVGTIPSEGGVCRQLDIVCNNQNGCELGRTTDGIDPVWAESQGILIRSGVVYPITTIAYGQQISVCHGGQCSKASCDYAWGLSFGTGMSFYARGV